MEGDAEKNRVAGVGMENGLDGSGVERNLAGDNSGASRAKEDLDGSMGEDLGTAATAGESKTERWPIDEAEARRLLREEKQRVETGLNAADKRGKKVLVIVLIAAGILCVAGLVFAMVMRGRNDGGMRDETASGVERTGRLEDSAVKELGYR